tara:strand:- start:1370 stop:1687 length:318 start_codon:yes stop_codon:yes gene_type:complete
MGKGKKMSGGSFMSKHAKNLLDYMPIDDHAGSPLHLEDEKKKKVKIKLEQLEGVTVTGGRGSGEQAPNQWTNTQTGYQEIVKPENVKPYHKKAKDIYAERMKNKK